MHPGPFELSVRILPARLQKSPLALCETVSADLGARALWCIPEHRNLGWIAQPDASGGGEERSCRNIYCEMLQL